MPDNGLAVAVRTSRLRLLHIVSTSFTLLLLAAMPAPAGAQDGVPPDEPPALAETGAPSISKDGRYVAFLSPLSLVSNDTGGWTDVYVFDRSTRVTRRVSVASSGVEANRDSMAPVISADGRYVAFSSAASNLVAGDTNGTDDIFLRDLNLSTTRRLSVGSTGAQANGASTKPAISSDGRFLAFQSHASNLISGDTNGLGDVFVRDAIGNATSRVSVSSTGGQGNGVSTSPSISANGQQVAFTTQATNLGAAPDTDGRQDIYLRDRSTGATSLVSPFTMESFDASVSGNGRYVTFTAALSLSNGTSEVYARDRTTGATHCVSCNVPQATDANYCARPLDDGRVYFVGDEYVFKGRLGSADYTELTYDETRYRDYHYEDRYYWCPAVAPDITLNEGAESFVSDLLVEGLKAAGFEAAKKLYLHFERKRGGGSKCVIEDQLPPIPPL